MQKLKSLFVMSGVAAAAVLAFSAPAQAGGYHDDDDHGDVKGNNTTSTYNDCGNSSSHSLIGDIALLNGLLGGDDDSDTDTDVVIVCDGGDIDD